MNDEIDYGAIASDAGKFMDQNLRLSDIEPEVEEEEVVEEEDDSQYIVD